jgi:hypothetical protein
MITQKITFLITTSNNHLSKMTTDGSLEFDAKHFLKIQAHVPVGKKGGGAGLKNLPLPPPPQQEISISKITFSFPSSRSMPLNNHFN